MTLRGGRRARPRTYIRKRSLMARTLLDKVWEAHTVRTLPSGQTQLLIGLHLIHEVTTPQAFQMLKDGKLKVRMPERTFGTLDHIIPTTDQTRPYADPLAEEMAVHMIRNMKEFNLPLFDTSTGKQGTVHVILAIINQLGVKGGVGYAYEYAGSVIDRMTMEERLTVCNMSIEGGARFGYVNPDTTTIEYLRGRQYAPAGAAFDKAAAWWKSIATESGAAFDDVARLDGAAIEPVVTWGINPGMSV